MIIERWVIVVVAAIAFAATLTSYLVITIARQRRARERGLARLGGRDLKAEREKNAMKSEDKALTFAAVAAAITVIGVAWAIAWGSTEYTRHPRPSIDRDQAAACMSSCAHACLDTNAPTQ